MSFWRGKRVFVTGHTGFKGSWLSFWLRLLGAEVCGYSLAPESSPNLFETLRLEKEIRSEIGDIRDQDSLEKILNDFKPEIVLHLAAQSLVRRSYKEPVATYATNLIGTVNLLDSLRRIDSAKSVVVVTTDKVYENNERNVSYIESDALGGFDPYSNSKACTELAVTAFRNSFFNGTDNRLATARAGNVIGGGDWSEDRLVPDIFRSLIFNAPLVIRFPDSTRPWQHVLEPLNGYMLLAQKLYEGNDDFTTAWNFGPRDQDSQTVSYLLTKIEEFWQEPVPHTLSDEAEPHESRFLKIDSTNARTKLSWRPILKLDDAIMLTVDWYKSFMKKDEMRKVTEEQIKFFLNAQYENSAT